MRRRPTYRLRSMLSGPSLGTLVVFAAAVVPMAVSVQAQGRPSSEAAAAPASTLVASPIQHVVLIYQENHSFDETLGVYCRTRATRCDGFRGPVKLKDHVVVPMSQSADIVPGVDHSVAGQASAIDGGAMDGWANIRGCAAPSYRCLTYYAPTQVPNLTTLADRFVVSDRTFSMAQSPSWGGHLYAAAANLDGFTGDNPKAISGVTAGPGWGCDSNKIATWVAPDGTASQQPSCVPKPDGSGAFRPTPVPHVSTIFGSLHAAGRSWKIYGAPPPATVGGQDVGYGWSICPSFASCLYSSQVNRLVPSANVLTDAAHGTLPSYSVLTPSWSSAATNAGADSSQHNDYSMLAGDNWIGKVVSAIQNGPDWASTAIFITYDDCGCFYDHVAPPVNPDGTQQGPRVPMVIVSPYAKAGSTDSANATFASILAFTEHTFGLPPLAANDAAAYDYANSFDYTQAPLSGATLAQHPLPPSTVSYLQNHQDEPDDDVS
jgi:phospholipase C